MIVRIHLWTLIFSIVTVCGMAAAFAAMFSYLSRYGNLDSLYGTLDASTYTHITSMFATEKVVLVTGLVVAVLGIGAMTVSAALPSRRPNYSL